MKRVIFLDRDGTIIVEPPIDYQVDSYEKLDFFRGAIGALTAISKLDYELVMVTNQDGLGTESLPTESFQGPHDLMMKILETEGVRWHEVIIDHTRPEDQAETRKPRLGRVQRYLNGEYDLKHSFV
ncbi:MAG: histidinol-phosphatase, partial [Saprospiraceae bacterium]|nr:histidinol-phosphatase [Saprospiraceae bacterium]